MIRFRFIVSCAVAIMVIEPVLQAQVYRQIDPTKRADDINNKNISFGNVNFQTLSPGMQNPASLPLSGKKVDVNGVNLPNAELKSLNLSEIQMKSSPQRNFAAKRATLPDKLPTQKTVASTNAPIARRQIYPFKPGGDEELRKQLNIPH